ncbi:PPC domain-containing DNA-binding protein [Pontibacter silvestris]|uniref:PPC domain-containing DNA-binding protein n=1 Tax=Pontibacter silvestris TaxID=2305183 RepID=A0ABW4WYU6_9BACT|nr:PPC domain-containing DNA-binding protein [Pontibacter silvestris]MCC9138489.1 DNA-binding protein [Pontibacter silvestris]
MMIKAVSFNCILATVLAVFGMSMTAYSQEYSSPTQPVETGRAPGVKVRLLSTNGQTQNYVLIFAKGDEVRSGLTEFAQKYNVKTAHFTAIGDATSARFGFFDYDRKMFKVIPINEPSEVSSLNGNIAVLNDKPVVHIHANVATEDGTVRGGHLLELITGPTLEVFLTVEPTTLYKKVNPQFGAGLIDPSLEH